MKRMTFNLASAVSLLLFAAAIGASFAGYWRAGQAQHWSAKRVSPTQLAERQVSLAYCWGVFVYGSNWFVTEHATPDEADHGMDAMARRPAVEFQTFDPIPVTLMRPGAREFGVVRFVSVQQPWPRRIVVVPCWVAALAFAILPALWAHSWRRRRTRQRRIAAGLCPECAYDLRESHGRCPECGTPAATSLRVSPATAT
jgi:hypothetical protein